MPETAADLGPVLITGASGGIGAATADRLARAGLTVYATARKTEALAQLADTGARLLPLDVTDEGSMRAVVEEIVARHGRVGALVNNAGYGAYGAVEEVSLDAVRDQFETNVFGLARLTQLALPSMRAARRGRIVNVSSMGGRITFPFGGYYHASKYAVEALSDALRMEVAPFGVRVTLIEPGLITTNFGATAAHNLGAATHGSSPYRQASDSVDRAMARSYANRRMTAGPDRVAAKIQRALTARRPRTRYVITPAARALITVGQVAPGRIWDRVIGGQFGL
jgi:short-subunit dehydrogenase